MTTEAEWIKFLEEDHKILKEVWQKRDLTFDVNYLYIPIYHPNGDLAYTKKRKEPSYKGSDKYLNAANIPITLYPFDVLAEAETLVIPEGELDALTLLSQNIPAISGTGGANGFKAEFCPYFKGKKVLICYDNDDKGQKGTKKTAKLLVNAGVEVKIVQLLKDGGVKDVGDFFKVGHTKEDFINLCKQAIKFESDNNRLSKSDVVYVGEGQEGDTGSNSVNLIDYNQWEAIISKNFPKLVFAAEAGLSLFGQLLIQDISNPCALVLIDMPSAGKTIILNSFCGNSRVYSTDSFTPASFVSQAANVKVEKLEDVDLLPKIRNKVFVIRDLAPFFGQRDDDLLKNMGLLTRVLDGEGLELHGGTHGRRGYTGDYSFMLLAASTPIPPKSFKLMGNLGSRLFFYNLRSKKKSEKELVKQLKGKAWKVKQEICKKATQGFLKYLFDQYPEGVEWDNENESERYLLLISRCGLLLARLRGTINIWKEEYGSEDFAYSEPIIEMPDRITQILYNLARGHALISGRTKINGEDIRIILNIALDSALLSRTRLFRFLIDNNGEVTTDQVMTQINCSRPTAHKEMETLKILGLANLRDGESYTPGRPEKIMALKEDLSWFAGEECSLLRGKKDESTDEESEEDIEEAS